LVGHELQNIGSLWDVVFYRKCVGWHCLLVLSRKLPLMELSLLTTAGQPPCIGGVATYGCYPQTLLPAAPSSHYAYRDRVRHLYLVLYGTNTNLLLGRIIILLHYSTYLYYTVRIVYRYSTIVVLYAPQIQKVELMLAILTPQRPVGPSALAELIPWPDTLAQRCLHRNV
jgi:hypothetical protein